MRLPRSRQNVEVKSRAAAILLVSYLAVLAAIVFFPHHLDLTPVEAIGIVILEAAARHSWSAWLTLEKMNDIANVALFFPLGLIATIAFGFRRWWIVVIVGAVISAGIEVVQLVFLPGRTPDYADVMSGIIGVVGGALLGVAISRASERRRIRKHPS
jgi:glycopeptide antibiotics resistance protein